jgi:hypothetical protein
VSAPSVVEVLDVVEDVSLGDFSGRVDLLPDSLLLQTAKKRFGYSVVPAVAVTFPLKADHSLCQSGADLGRQQGVQLGPILGRG